MRKISVIGVGIVSFALGAVIVGLWDRRGDGNVDGGASGDERKLTALGGGERGSDWEDGASGRPVPAMDELTKMVDPSDWGSSKVGLEARLQGVGVEELKALLVDLDTNAVGESRHVMMQAVGERIAKIDPRAAIAFASDPENYIAAMWLIEPAMSELARQAPQEAFDLAAGLKDRSQRSQAVKSVLMAAMTSRSELLPSLMSDKRVLEVLRNDSWNMGQLVGRWAEQDPVAAASFATRLPPGSLRERGIREAAQIWVALAPDAAIQWARGLGDGGVGKEAIGAMMDELVKKDPDAALELLGTSRAQDRLPLLRSIAGNLSWRDPEKAIEWLGTLENQKDIENAISSMAGAAVRFGVDRSEGLLSKLPEKKRVEIGKYFVSNLMNRDSEAAERWVDSIEDPEVQSSYREAMIQQLSWSDPAKAVSMIIAEENPTSEMKSRLSTSFHYLAQQDLDAARTAMEQLKDEGMRSKAFQSILNAWGEDDPAAAAASVLEQTKDPALQRQQLATLASSWAERDVDAALDWAKQQPASLQVAVADKVIARMVRQGSGERARETLVALMAEFPEEASKPQRLRDSLTSVLDLSGEEDPQRGIEIVNQLTTEDAQKHAVAALVGGWAGSELEEARAWVGGLGAGPVRDAAAGKIIETLIGKEPSAAFEMALSLESTEVREKVLHRSFQTLFNFDPAAARAAFQGAQLSVEERKKLGAQFD